MKLAIISEPPVENYQALCKLLEQLGLDISQVWVAVNRGLCDSALQWAKKQNISVRRVPLNRSRYGRKALKFQGDFLVRDADALLLLWDGMRSYGRQLIALATLQGKPIYLFDTNFRVLKHYFI